MKSIFTHTSTNFRTQTLLCLPTSQSVQVMTPRGDDKPTVSHPAIRLVVRRRRGSRVTPERADDISATIPLAVTLLRWAEVFPLSFPIVSHTSPSHGVPLHTNHSRTQLEESQSHYAHVLGGPLMHIGQLCTSPSAFNSYSWITVEEQ